MRRGRGPRGASDLGGMTGSRGRDAQVECVGTREFETLAATVREIDDRLRRLETLLFHIPVPDIQRIIKVIEAAGLESDVPEPAEVQPEQEVAPEDQDQVQLLETNRGRGPALHCQDQDRASKWVHVDREVAHSTCAAANSELRRGMDLAEEETEGLAAAEGCRLQSGLTSCALVDSRAHEELQAQQDFKDNVLGLGFCRMRPQAGEIWRFTTTSRIFQLFDDEFGRAASSRMGPTKGSWWREETHSYPQLVTITAAPMDAEFVEVRGRGDTASWLKGWVRLWDLSGRPLLEPDRY